VPPLEFDAAGLPVQIFRSEQEPIGPAFRTYEEARASVPPERWQNTDTKPPHITENILSRDGKVIGTWWEVSESMSDKHIKGVGRLGDTEQKALLRIRASADLHLEIRGSYPPCASVKGGCDAAMQFVAEKSGMRITYRTMGREVDHEENVIEYPRDPQPRDSPARVRTLRPSQAKSAEEAYKAAYDEARRQPSTAVNQGERNLADVARRCGANVQEFLDANPNLKSSSRLRPGQQIELPDSVALKQAKEAGSAAKSAWLRAHRL
jgi:hypothetical protein